MLKTILRKHKKQSFLLIIAAILIVAAPSVWAQPVAYFTQNGKGGSGNPQALGGTNNTAQSVAFEMFLDFTSDVDTPTGPMVLWEMGATGNGAALVLEGEELHFFAGNSNDDVVSGLHGLSALQEDVQIVSVYEIGAGTGTDELLSVYVNGSLIISGDADTANAWAGSDAGGVGLEQGGSRTRYVGTTLFPNAVSDILEFPNNTDISLSIYRLASSGGDPDNTLDNIVVNPVPEPGSVAIAIVCGVALVGLARRRSR